MSVHPLIITIFYPFIHRFSVVKSQPRIKQPQSRPADLRVSVTIWNTFPKSGTSVTVLFPPVRKTDFSDVKIVGCRSGKSLTILYFSITILSFLEKPVNGALCGHGYSSFPHEPLMKSLLGLRRTITTIPASFRCLGPAGKNQSII